PDEQSAKLDVIIETPRGSRNKYKYEPSNKMYKLSKVMPEGMVFPYDFGYIPSTKAEDGDPLDVLVLTDEPLFPGCLIECKLIGAIEAEQEEKGKKHRNDRLVAVATQSLLYSEIEKLGQLNPVVLKQIKDFFVNYQRVRDIRFTVLGEHGPERAVEILQKSAAHKHAA
ncbi:MAG: inorganic diphosphatase, partial [Acidobacteriaceae bacterium]|nr:inorganic diphosphatase [Acidobacteriaceae bacterium]